MSERRRPTKARKGRKLPKMRREKNPGKGYRSYKGKIADCDVYIGHDTGDRDYEFTVVKNGKMVDFGTARSFEAAKEHASEVATEA